MAQCRYLAGALGLMIATMSVGSAGHAQDSLEEAMAEMSPAEQLMAISSFEFAGTCLMNAPEFSGVREQMTENGFTTPTDDLEIFAREDGSLAGFGAVLLSPEGPEAIGCLQYVPGTDASYATATISPVLEKFFSNTRYTPYEQDHYWQATTMTGSNVMVIVSPKHEGPYEGKTLLMVIPSD